MHFNRARLLGLWGLFLGIVPTIVLIISHFPIPGLIGFMEECRDFVVAAISIVLFFVGLKISGSADEYRSISNEFREVYDLHVLDIPRNPFVLPRHNSDPERMQSLLEEGARNYRDHPKYEAWYEEVFSDNHYANVIACQMDNALYTYHIYKETVRLYQGLTIALLVIVVVPAILLRNPATMLLIFIATFDLLVTFLESINEIRNQQETLAGMRDVILSEDIDLALDSRDIERSKQLIMEHLGDRYDVQDARNDPAYSPRLSNFRIRHRKSIVAEKDSVLFESYRYTRRTARWTNR